MAEHLNTSEVAAKTGVPEATLIRWRYEGSGPPFVRLGRLIRYPVDLLDAWLHSNLVTPQR